MFRITQRRQHTAENAAGIDVYGAVEPLGFGHGRVSVNHHSRTTVLCSPVVTHRQAKLIGFAGGFPEKAEVAHPGGTAPLHFLLEPGVRHHKLTAVQDIMADQALDKRNGFFLERFPKVIGQRL